jgi:hypothetical protein
MHCDIADDLPMVPMMNEAPIFCGTQGTSQPIVSTPECKRTDGWPLTIGDLMTM